MIPVSEQETVIQFNRDGKTCNIWTSDSTMITKLNKLCKSSPELYKLTKSCKTQDGEFAGNQYLLTNKKLVSLRSSKVTRVMTDEQKAAAAERMRKIKNVQKDG